MSAGELDSVGNGRRGSFDLKLDRAEKHLVDLESAIATYTASHPYEVKLGIEGKRRKRAARLHFTAQPSQEISLIAADFIYNIRCGLDHLAVSLVRSTGRRSVAFPIFWQGVWESPVEGENRERTKDRTRWITYVGGMHPDAVALLKEAQPPDVGPNADNTHSLAMLNRLRNADAHSKLIAVAAGLGHPVGVCYDFQGQEIGRFVPAELAADEDLVDGAELAGIPRSAARVQLLGTPRVTIRVGQVKNAGYLIVPAFREIFLKDARRLADELRPFVV